MNAQLSIRDQVCPNSRCRLFGAQTSVIIHSKQPARFKCTACGKTWNSDYRKATFALRKNEATFYRARELIFHNFSVRTVARHLHVSPGTVQRWKKRFDL